MDFCKTNFILTTTALTLDSNTLLAENIYNRDLNYQYFSDGFNDDNTTTSITITFDSTTAVSRIALYDINWKDFTFFYDGTTASTFSLNNADTSTSDYSSNSSTSMFFRFDTLLTDSITFDITGTQTADQEKVVGFIYVSDTYFEFDRIPAAGGYKPVTNAKQVVHRMGDGGTKVHNIARKNQIDLSFKYLTTAQRNQLETIYDLQDVFWFAPFATTTGWNGLFFEANWIGDFDFDRYSDNALDSGFSGKIKLRET